jgi:Zn-dependent protease with chaperone function
MIYTSFIYLLAAIALFTAAPVRDSQFLPLAGDLVLTLFLYLFFFQMTRLQLRWMRVGSRDSLGSHLDAQQNRARFFSRFRLLSLILYAVSIYFFDLKALIARLPGAAHLEVVQNLFGIGAFVLFWCILWYWEYREGDAPAEMETAWGYIQGQLSMQFGVFVPWLILNLLLDILLLLPLPWLQGWVGEPLFQLAFYAVFFLLLLVFSPLIMIRFWRCRPLEDSELKRDIEALFQSQKVRFKGILSWNLMGGGLITAGVVGLFPGTRYLLITPRLRQVLDRDELLAVTAHEIAHVKRGHLLHYVGFVLGFVLVSMGSIQHLLTLFFNTAWGQAMLINGQGELRGDVYTFFNVFLLLYFLVFYFRFVFGYFMRHFERQADLYPISAGLPSAPLVSAFAKLARITGDDGSRSNWHHFTLPERMAVVEAAAADPEQIRQHNRSLRRSLVIFWTAMLLLVVFLYSPFIGSSRRISELEGWAQILEKKLLTEPQNTQALTNLAQVYTEMKRWQDAMTAYQDSLALDPNQATALNNLAWLLLTCEDETLQDPVKALPLAEMAVSLEYGPTTLDTLAEAYHQNERWEEAFKMAREAFRLAERDPGDHFARQLRKMEKAWKDNRFFEEARRSGKTV